MRHIYRPREILFNVCPMCENFRCLDMGGEMPLAGGSPPPLPLLLAADF